MAYLEYTGRELCFVAGDTGRQGDICVKIGKTKLTGAEVFKYFDVSYADNVQKGKATIILQSKEKLDDGSVNPYIGLCKGTFSITRRNLK